MITKQSAIGVLLVVVVAVGAWAIGAGVTARVGAGEARQPAGEKPAKPPVKVASPKPAPAK